MSRDQSGNKNRTREYDWREEYKRELENLKVVKTVLKSSGQIDTHFLQVESIACGHFRVPSAVA